MKRFKNNNNSPAKKTEKIIDIQKLTSCALCISGAISNFAGFIISLFDGSGNIVKITTLISMFIIISLGLFLIKLKKYNLYNIIVSFITGSFLLPVIFLSFGEISQGEAFVFYFFITAPAYGISISKKHPLGFILFFITILEINLLLKMYINLSLVKIISFNVVYSFIFVFIFLFSNITYSYYKRVKKGAYNDELTGLYNRKKLNEALMEENYRYGIMMDIDNFHECNNNFGHIYGDLVLQKLADICLTICSDEFKMYRFGGEEFFILSRFGFAKTVMKLRDIQNIFKKETGVTLSIGIAEKKDYTPYQEVVKIADENMFFVKKHGKNNICYENNFVKS